MERERSNTDRWMDRGREGQTDRKKGGMSQQREMEVWTDEGELNDREGCMDGEREREGKLTNRRRDSGWVGWSDG